MMAMLSLGAGIIIRVILFVVVLFSLSFFNYAVVNAHTVVTDENKESGAIIHVAPDDDPIAGEVSSIFVDITGGVISEDTHYFSMSVTDTTGFAYPISTNLSGSTVSGLYNFPLRGAYTIEVVAVDRESGKKTVFQETQQVTRTADQASASAIPVWVYGVLVVLLLVFGGGLYAFYVRGKA